MLNSHKCSTSISVKWDSSYFESCRHGDKCTRKLLKFFCDQSLPECKVSLEWRLSQDFEYQKPESPFNGVIALTFEFNIFPLLTVDGLNVRGFRGLV